VLVLTKIIRGDEVSNIVLITNNDVVEKNYSKEMCVEHFQNANFIETLELVRDKIHAGHKLLTHPLSGSVKPNDTPYKTVVISKAKGALDYSGLQIIEDSLESAKKFICGRSTPNWTDKVKADFKLIDYTIITTAIQSMNGKFIG